MFRLLFFNDTATTEIYTYVHTLSLHDALPILVGLPEAAVRESRDRVCAAIRCAQFEFPQRAITINLAPADLPKDGGRFDLPIALGILADRKSTRLNSSH